MYVTFDKERGRVWYMILEASIPRTSDPRWSQNESFYPTSKYASARIQDDRIAFKAFHEGGLVFVDNKLQPTSLLVEDKPGPADAGMSKVVYDPKEGALCVSENGELVPIFSVPGARKE